MFSNKKLNGGRIVLPFVHGEAREARWAGYPFISLRCLNGNIDVLP
jgi:hypothetical protein